jgi:hypothetical protein
MRIDQCFSAFRAVEIAVLACLTSRCNEVTEIRRNLNLFNIHSNEFHTKLWGHCECNPAVPCRAMLSAST